MVCFISMYSKIAEVSLCVCVLLWSKIYNILYVLGFYSFFLQREICYYYYFREYILSYQIMKNFEQKFESAKIPEYYNFYFNYRKIKQEIF